MKFFFAGHAGCYNRGCEAIVRATVTMLRKEFGQPEITISSSDYENDKLIDFGPNIQIIPAKKITRDRWTWQWMCRQTHKVLSKEYRQNYWKRVYLPIISAIEEADIVLSIGGDNYTVDYGYPNYFLGLNQLVKEKKKKLVIWAASIGPFPKDDRLSGTIDNLRSVDLINIREPCSLNYLTQLGITENVKRVADPAFLLPLKPVSLEGAWLNTPKGILGVNISPILSHYRKSGNDIEIIAEVTLFLRRIIKEMGLYILLIPHVTKSNSSTNNDYIFMDGIYKQLKDTAMISRVSSEYNAMQIKYIISKCRFFIGARTHSTIAALSTNVPTLSIGYSLKSKGINEDIFGNHDFLLSIEDLTAETLFSKFTKMFNKESKIRQILSKKSPEINNLAYENIKYLKEIL